MPEKGWSIREVVFVRMALIEKCECALKELIDFFFRDLVRREESVQIKLRKTAIRYARGKKFPQAAGFDGSQSANLLEHNAPLGILKNSGIEQFADFQPRPALDQHRA